MSVASGIIVGWPTTAASIPAGWDRVTTLDDRFGKGTAAGVDPDVAGGAAAHTHTSPSHSHSLGSHSHPGTTGLPSAPTNAPSTGADAASTTHTHTYTSGAVGGTVSAAVGSFSSENSIPTFFRMIWIQSDGTPLGIPDGAVAFYDAATPPADWIQHVASKDRFLRGAAPAGDAGGTGGGGGHVHSDGSHTHPIAGHTHGTAASSTATGTDSIAIGNGVAWSELSHTHSTVTLADTADGPTGTPTAANTGSTTYEPSFHTLLAIENDKGADDLPLLIIAAWLGLISAIPAAWVLCDGGSGTPDLRNRFIKCANVGGDVGTTGGSAGHDHTNPGTHTHSAAHTHDSTTDAASAFATGAFPLGALGASALHTHLAGASDLAGGTSGATAQTVNTTADTQPAFRTVVWLELQAVLVVTIDDPNQDDVENNPTFLIDWSFGGAEVQQDFRVQIFTDAGATNEVYDSGTVITAVTQEQVTRPLNTGNDYYIRVTATDTLGVNGISGIRHITTSWTPPIEITGLTVAEIEEPD